jgi:hypothetical protein
MTGIRPKTSLQLAKNKKSGPIALTALAQSVPDKMRLLILRPLIKHQALAD